MPNTPCSIGSGITALAAAFSLATDEHMALAKELFLALGRVVIVEEPQMDAVTGLSGCGPAYVYLIIEALADVGVSLGLSRAVSLELAAQTLHGSAQLLLDSGSHPAALKDEVATPGGCTIDGLLALESGLLRATLVQAVSAASARSSVLAKCFARSRRFASKAPREPIIRLETEPGRQPQIDVVDFGRRRHHCERLTVELGYPHMRT